MKCCNDVLEEFCQFLSVEKGLGKSTLSSYISDIKKFITFLARREEGCKTDFDSLSDNILIKAQKEDIGCYISHLSNQSSSRSTIARALSSIKQLFYFLFFEGYVKTNESSSIESVKSKRKLPKFSSNEEINILFKYLYLQGNKQNVLICEMLYSMGLRVSELISIKISDLSYENGAFHTLLVNGKGNKERILPIASHINLLLIHFINEQFYINDISKDLFKIRSDFLFKSKSSEGHLTRQYIAKMLKKKCIESGIKILSPHSLRHTFATQLLKNGANIFFVKSLLGHSSLSTTQIYTHIEQSDLKETIKNFHPMEENFV